LLIIHLFIIPFPSIELAHSNHDLVRKHGGLVWVKHMWDPATRGVENGLEDHPFMSIIV
jgi:hypothetical protein